MPDLVDIHRGLLRMRALLADLDRTDKPVDRRQVADGIRHELDAAIRWAAGELGRLRSAAEGYRLGKVRADAPSTSRATAERVTVKSGTGRHKVLYALYRSAPDGLTDYELANLTELAPSTERPRRGELVDAGLVRATAATRRHKGEVWTVWVITTSGVAALRAISPILPEVALEDDAAAQPGLF
jgi:hypothetical protein